MASFVLKLVTIVSTNYKFLIQGVLCKKKSFPYWIGFLFFLNIQRLSVTNCHDKNLSN